MSFPGISFSTWNADPGMRRIVNRNSSRMEAGESCKKVYRNYLNHSWPASLARHEARFSPERPAPYAYANPTAPVKADVDILRSWFVY